MKRPDGWHATSARLAGLFLILGLALQSAPVYALRPTNAGMEESATRRELENQLAAPQDNGQPRVIIEPAGSRAAEDVKRGRKTGSQFRLWLPLRPVSAGLEEKRQVGVAFNGSEMGAVLRNKIQVQILDHPELSIPGNLHKAITSFLVELVEDIHKYGYPVVGRADEYVPRGNGRYQTTLTAQVQPGRVVISIQDETARFQREAARQERFEPYFYGERILQIPDYEHLQRRSVEGARGGWGFPILHGLYHRYEMQMEEKVVDDVGVHITLSFPVRPDRWWRFHWKIADELRKLPGGPLAAGDFAKALRLRPSTLEAHQWRVLTERENAYRKATGKEASTIEIISTLEGGLTTSGLEERSPLRWGSWGPISVQLKEYPKEDWGSLMEGVDRFLRGTASLDDTLEQSALGYTQIYGIPRMMSTLREQVGGRGAVERVSLALDWAAALREWFYPNGMGVVDADDLFLQVVGGAIPLAGEAARSEGEFRENLKNLARFLLKLHRVTPPKKRMDFANVVGPVVSYYAGFPQPLRPDSSEEFAEHLELFELFITSGWDLRDVAPDEFAALAREFHEVEVSMEASGVAPLPRRDEVWVPARLAASAAGLEEGIRFAPAEEEAGVHGFILEGQGLPLGRLLAVAAAEQERHEGRPIYFAGVATQDQLDALAGHLPADAARLLRERIVVSNGIAADEARDRAVDKLYRQVPQDDRGMLQVTWMDFLMQDLARQIRMLLGLAGLRLAEPLDEQRALALVEAA